MFTYSVFIFPYISLTGVLAPLSGRCWGWVPLILSIAVDRRDGSQLIGSGRDDVEAALGVEGP